METKIKKSSSTILRKKAEKHLKENTSSKFIYTADSKEIEKQFYWLANSFGKKSSHFAQATFSTTPAIRPIWSPFHDKLNSPFIE